MRGWRWLRHGAGPGAWNMGVDEALLVSAARGTATLRLYRWQGPWLSLGYAQVLDDFRREACRAAGVGVVRRATGGRAVLHGCDLTYAVAAPLSHLPGGLHASSARIARGLLAGLRSLGVEAECVEPEDAERGIGFDCFAHAGAHEIRRRGRKLCGSAQRRAGGALLQHGSIRLAPDPEPVRRAAGLAGPGASLLELGCPCEPETLCAALSAGLADALGVRLEPGELEPGESVRAAGRQAESPGVTPSPQGPP
jgi:lipoate-protein ligase A